MSRRALGALGARPAADVVFGPAADGGYYLVGLRRMRDDREATLFDPSIPWGGPDVLARSQAAAAAAGLRSARVETLHDIDTAADLTHLRARLDGAGDSRVAGRRTTGGRAVARAGEPHPLTPSPAEALESPRPGGGGVPRRRRSPPARAAHARSCTHMHDFRGWAGAARASRPQWAHATHRRACPERPRSTCLHLSLADMRRGGGGGGGGGGSSAQRLYIPEVSSNSFYET